MSSTEGPQDYSEHFTDEGFWQKLSRFAITAGKEVVERGLILYYTAIDDDTPAKAKAVIYSALGYFILPIDLIPDMVPVAGFSDDLGALAIALGIVMAHIKPKHRELARKKLQEWFGTFAPEPQA